MIMTGDLPDAKDYKGTGVCEDLNLLEDLAISPGVFLSTDSDWLLPGPLQFDKVLILGLGVVEFGELIALIVWCNVERCKSFLTTDDESTLDDRVICDTVNGSTSEDILARSFEASEEAANQVGGHENLGELIIVFVVQLPE